MSAGELNSSSDSIDSTESEVGNSLRSELKSISDIVKKLKNFKPETVSTPVKKGKGRPKAASQQDLESISSVLKQICDFNYRILDKVDQLESSNRILREKLTNNLPTPNKEPTHPQPSTSTRAQPLYGQNNRIESINSRLDHVEQEKLLDTIKIEGDLCNEIIDNFSSAPTKDYNILKNHITSSICSIEQNIIQPQDIIKVNVVGNERKHLRVKLSSSSVRVKIHKTVKKRNSDLRTNRETPALFTNDYLTSLRSKLSYDLRKLKKEHPSKIKSSYVFNGSVCCVLTASDRVLHVNTAASYSDLVSSLQRTDEHEQ